MDTTAVITLVALAVLVVVALVWFLGGRKRSSQLHDRFGPEYEHTVDRAGSKRRAERELEKRTERREHYEVRELDRRRRQEYATRWRAVQEDFVDRPDHAVATAQTLVTEVLRERGYPVDDPDVVSVDHGEVMGEYRSAQAISALNDRGEATTEQLRQALVHYRALFGRLLGGDGEGREAAHDPYPQEQPQRRRERH